MVEPAILSSPGKARAPLLNDEPLLARVARALLHARLEAILIGNAAAALQGAPVTALDFDFMFRSTPANLRKLKVFARELDAVITRDPGEDAR